MEEISGKRKLGKVVTLHHREFPLVAVFGVFVLMERSSHWFEREELPSHENRHAFLRSFFKWIIGLVTATHSISIFGFSEMDFYLFVLFFRVFIFILFGDAAEIFFCIFCLY